MAIHLPFPNNTSLPEKEEPDSGPYQQRSWMEYIIALFGVVGFVFISTLICNDKACVKTQKINVASSNVVDTQSQQNAESKTLHSLTLASSVD